MSTHGPIEEDQRRLMNVLAQTLDELFNGPDPTEQTRKVGFVLLTAKFGEADNGRVNYISNGDRPSMLQMMEELLSRMKGEHPEEKAGG